MNIKVLILSIFLMFNTYVFSQSSNKSDLYTGISYNLVFFTNSFVDNVYPSFSMQELFFRSEINFFIGHKVSNLLAFEFSPSFIYTKSSARDGYYFESSTISNTQTYYYPYNAYYLSIPLNIKMKIYPFNTDFSYFMDRIFIGIAGGPIYIKEKYDIYEYPNEIRYNPISYKTFDNSIWTGNFILSIGYNSKEKLNYGFEIGYRIVPLPANREYPLSINMASNMNALLIGMKIGLNL